MKKLNDLLDIWRITLKGVHIVEDAFAGVAGAGPEKIKLLLEMIRQWFDANTPDEPWEKVASTATAIASAAVAAFNKLGIFKKVLGG